MALSAQDHVVVIGAGISGLTAAWELRGGPGGPGPSTPAVTVLEASAALGGALRSAPFAGRVVDLGADGFLGRRPEALDLCRALGLDDVLRPVTGRGAAVWARGRLRRLPDGLALGIPTRFWPTARSGTLGVRGLAGLARDALLPRPDLRGPIGDRSVGPLVARKLGKAVVDTLVDPLLGGIHAGTVDDLSAAATFPPLLAAAQRRGSLMRALRAEVPAPDPDAPPLFWSLQGGMAALVARLGVEVTGRGVSIRTSAPARQLDAGDGRWVVQTDGGPVDADAVVLALPAPAAAVLLGPHDAEAAGLLAGIAYASVTLVTFRVPAGALAGPLTGTGFLVPRRSRRPGTREGWAVTAVTYLTEKWAHLAGEDDVLLRASLGRFGDTRPDGWTDSEAAERAWEELGLLMGVRGAPDETMVVRYPAALPQYRVHHLMRAAGIASSVARLGGLAVAGSAYQGVGIPACIASGRAAARTLL